MHIERVIEEFKKDECVRCHHCGSNIAKEKWDSEWDNKHPDAHHYKSAICECGHKIWVKVDFLGSGHDHLLKENPDPIESMIRKVREGENCSKN